MNMSRMNDIFMLLLLLRHTFAMFYTKCECTFICVGEWVCENTLQEPANHRSTNEISNIVFGCVFVCNVYSMSALWLCRHHSNIFEISIGIRILHYSHWMEISCSICSCFGNSCWKMSLNCCVYIFWYYVNWSGNCSSTCISMNETFMLVVGWNNKMGKSESWFVCWFAFTKTPPPYMMLPMKLTTTANAATTSILPWAYMCVQKHICLHIKYEICTFNMIVAIHIAFKKKNCSYHPSTLTVIIT